MTRYFFAVALGVGCLTASADDSLPKELSADQDAALIRSAEITGLAIYRHDAAAAIVTDAALKIRAFKKDKRVKGWVTEQQQDQIVVTFIDKTPSALYRGAVSMEGVAGPITTLESPAPLTDYEEGAATARSAALAVTFEPCSRSYNAVVLPPDQKSGNWVVYLLPETTDADVVPIGGTYRIEIVLGDQPSRIARRLVNGRWVRFDSGSGSGSASLAITRTARSKNRGSQATDSRAEKNGGVDLGIWT